MIPRLESLEAIKAVTQLLVGGVPFTQEASGLLETVAGASGPLETVTWESVWWLLVSTSSFVMGPSFSLYILNLRYSSTASCVSERLPSPCADEEESGCEILIKADGEAAGSPGSYPRTPAPPASQLQDGLPSSKEDSQEPPST